MAGPALRRPGHTHEMRPTTMTAAHKTGNLAELVCSNSLKSTCRRLRPAFSKQR